MYIAKDFKEYSTAPVFFNDLKEFLLGTGLFTLIEEDFEEESSVYFKLRHKNAVVKIGRNGDNYLFCECYLLINGNELLKEENLVIRVKNNTDDTATRNVKILLISNGDNLVFKIGGYDSLMFNNTGTTRIVVADNDLYIFADDSTTSANAVNAIDEYFTYRPYHPYSKSQTELFLDPELPWTRVSDGSFYSNSIGITGLGGAECGKVYQLADGTKYYAIFNNMAIEMGEEFVYESTEA